MKGLTLLLIAGLAVVALPASSFAQGCGGWMTPHYSGYQGYTLGPAPGGKVKVYTNSYVDGYTSGVCPFGCGCGGTQHMGQVSTTIKQHSNGAVIGSSQTNGGYVSWNSYIGVTNPLDIVGVPGVVYDFTSNPRVNCTQVGTIFSASLLNPVMADIPSYMLVVFDITNPPTTGHPNEWRQVLYETHYLSGALAKGVTLGEDFTYTQSTPPCNGTIRLNTNQCSSNPAITNTYGRFFDQWEISSSATPAGCGIDNVVDHWNDCLQLYVVGAATYGTLTGYTHTDHINILGHITPPNSNGMTTGTRINP